MRTPLANVQSLGWAQEEAMLQVACSHSGRLITSVADKAQGGEAAIQAAACLRRSAGTSPAAPGLT